MKLTIEDKYINDLSDFLIKNYEELELKISSLKKEQETIKLLFSRLNKRIPKSERVRLWG